MSQSSRRPRVVFDCNTLVQSLASDLGPAAACLRAFESGYFDLLLSKATFTELQRVLQYEEVLAISPHMTELRIAGFLQRLAYRGTWIRRVRHLMDYPRDPDDEHYLDLAITAKAEYLVTRDNDLLELMSGHASICKQFRKRSHPLKILEPIRFLNEIGCPWSRTNSS